MPLRRSGIDADSPHPATESAGSATHPPRTGSAFGLLGLRLGLVAVSTVLVWLCLRTIAPGTAFPPDPMIAALTLLPVNIICLVVTLRLYRRNGVSVRRVFSPEPRAVWKEIVWALLWMTVLAVPFALAVGGTMWVLHGDDITTAFATVFYNPDATPLFSPQTGLILGIIAFVTFAPLNAPSEELVYRGYAQSGLSGALPAWLAILVTSFVFGLQHAFFAPTTDAVVVYVVAFTVWGIGSALIVRWQQRLLPVTIAHVLVNLSTSSPAVVFPILQLSGVI